MPRNLILSLVSVLWLVPFAEPLRAEESRLTPELTVQAHAKADNRLLVEIAEMVATWTDRCTETEKEKDAGASMCWRDAAAVADDYASGYEGPVIERLQLLESAWLQRAVELQPSVKAKAPSAAPVSATQPVRKALRVEKPDRAAKVVPTAFVSQKRREEKVAPGKGISLAPGAGSSSAARKAEIRAIRKQLRSIAGRIDCLASDCPRGAN